MSESFGIMDEGYFVSRKEILRWVNHTLGLDLTAVEQLGSGAVYCQLMDALLPGMAPLHKINWRARQEYEFIQNFKLLQTIFDKMGISKKVEVSMITIQIQRLAKCKYQDNLEFIQWLKRYIQVQGGCKEGYDAPARRAHAQLDLSFCEKQRKVNTSYNKENIKKGGLLEMSMETKRSVTDLHENALKTPKGRTSMTNLSSPFRSSFTKKPISITAKKEPTPTEEHQKLSQIKQILKKETVRDSQTQLNRIRSLLNVPRIDQQEDLDCI